MGQRFTDGSDITIPFATNGDKSATPFAYDIGYTPEYSLNLNNPSALAVPRTVCNGIWNGTSGVCADINRNGGALPWLSTINYLEGAIVTAGDPSSNLYKAISANINQNPVNNPTVWQSFATNDSTGQPFYLETSGGNDYTLQSVIPAQAPAQYFDGMLVSFIPSTTNTSTCTINVNGLGQIPVIDQNLNPLISGEISTDGVAVLFYFGGVFLLQRNAGTPILQVRLDGTGGIIGLPKGVTQGDINAPEGVLQGGAPAGRAAFFQVSFPNPPLTGNYRIFCSMEDRVQASTIVLIGADNIPFDQNERIKTVASGPNGVDVFSPTPQSFYIIAIPTTYGVNGFNVGYSSNPIRDNYMTPFSVNISVYDNETPPLTTTFMKKMLEDKNSRTKEGVKDLIAQIKADFDEVRKKSHALFEKKRQERNEKIIKMSKKSIT